MSDNTDFISESLDAIRGQLDRFDKRQREIFSEVTSHRVDAKIAMEMLAFASVNDISDDEETDGLLKKLERELDEYYDALCEATDALTNASEKSNDLHSALKGVHRYAERIREGQM